MNKKPIHVSLFLHRWEKKSEVILFESFVADVRGARWEVLAKSYRDLCRRGQTREAAAIKDNLAAITGAGVCRGGHADAQLQQFSHLMGLDFDDVGERLPQAVALLRTLPYVVLEFISISGNGIKVFVYVEVDQAQQYAEAYPVVAGEVSRVLGIPYDPACSNVARLCYGSWDADAYYNPDAEPFRWQERVPLAAVPTPVGNVAPVVSASSLSSARGFIAGFLTHFEQNNRFEKGQRNDFLLKLGRAARYKEFSHSELQLLVRLCIHRFAGAGVTVADVEKRIVSGYQFIDAKTDGAALWSESHQSHGSPAVAPQDREADSPEEELEQLLEKSEKLRQEVSYFPDELFDRLPPLLAQGVGLARNKRERDMLLMGMLANISGCLPGVQILYDQVYCSMHFYFVAIAHAGSGKGTLALAALLPGAIHRHYEEQNRQAAREYKEAQLRWELEVKQAAKARRVPDLSLSPDAPRLMTLCVSANISKSRLIIYLQDNGKLGAIINATELDMVSGAIRQDCGKHDDVFRAAFQHEPVSSDYKVDGRQVMAEEPHLACCFAGTPSQLALFVASQENGLYSRISFYGGQSEWAWRSAAPRQGGVDYRAAFKELSNQLLSMHLFLLQSPTEVVFTPRQWAEHTERFSGWLSDVVGEKEDSPGAIVLRHGLIAMRIAGILTALRKCECAFTMLEYSCSDDDFRTAMQLTEVLLEHSLLLSSSLPKVDKQARPLKAYFRLLPIFAQLKTTFTYQEFMEEVHLQKLPDSTAKRLLAKAVAAKVLEKEGSTYHKKKAKGDVQAQA